jgi:hypothetical protein
MPAKLYMNKTNAEYILAENYVMVRPLVFLS